MRETRPMQIASDTLTPAHVTSAALRLLLGAATLAAVFQIAPASADSHAAPAWEWTSSASAPYRPVKVLDTDAMPIEYTRGSRASWGVKTLFENPESGGHLTIISIPPGAEGALNHYHEFHEWAWIMFGDFTNNESTHPDQVYGPLQRFVAGDFLSRPPYSLHGGERGRQKFMASQIGSEILIMEESNVGAKTWKVDPACRDGQDPDGECSGYNPNYRDVKQWATPRIIDTLNDMPFQPVPGAAGLHVKHLIDDPLHGFRARMWYLEGGAATPAQLRPHYYREAYQFNFLVSGDLTIQAWASDGEAAETRALERNNYFERAPMSIFGVASEDASAGGAVWLEVTYARGTTWTDDDEVTPIEAPVYPGN
jgi:hypothetical protein